MKTLTEYLNYEENVLKKNKNYDEYFDKWSLFWFESIFKPVFDYSYTSCDYDEEYFNLLLQRHQNNDLIIYYNDNIYDKRDKTELYYKLKYCKKQLKELFPNIVLLDVDMLKKKCDFHKISFEKNKKNIEQYCPFINFFNRDDCSFLENNPNMTNKILEIHKHFNWKVKKNDCKSKTISSFIDNSDSDIDLNLNPLITQELIKQNPNFTWNIEKLAKNDFTKMRIDYIKNLMSKK